MALENVMRVDNGNIVTGGGAGGSSVEIDWDDWCELTPEEQETGDWTIINCPWADGNVSVDLMTKLWENPSPTASFAAQDITLASDDYDLLLILSSYSTSIIRFALAAIGTSGYLNFADYSSSSPIAMYRAYTASNNKVTFTDNLRNGSTANGYLIPIVIYGIKLTASVKINAIAMDVSTSADKCMMSDGVTSVEDRLDANTISSENVVLLTYNTEYTTLSDGYFRISCNSGLDTWATGYVNNIPVIRCTSVPTQTANGMVSVYVHKGSKIKFDGKNSTDASGKFYPLT